MSSSSRTRPEVFRERGYRNGSILRIKMVNFLTYDECEAFPGPKLNMVIGPNGTGKSSISAAICLALCGDPKLIGRSDDLSTFVNNKSDSDEAFIEVDLLRENSITTIRRTFCKSKANKKGRRARNSEFKVDDQDTSFAEVQQLVKSLNINFDNLISYMPQDRVGEFTTLDAKKLLSETLRAVENPDGNGSTMKDEMDELIHLQNEQMQEAGQERTIEKNIENLRAELASMQPSVDRMREREEVKRRIRLYQIKLEYLTFQYNKAKLAETKEQLEVLKREMNDMEAQLDGLRAEHREADVRLRRVAQSQKQLQRQTAARCEEASTVAAKCEDLSEKRASAISEMNRILTERQRLETRRQGAVEQLTRMEAELAQLTGEEPVWKQRMTDLRTQQQGFLHDEQELDTPMAQKRRDLQQLTDQEQQINRRLANMTDWKAIARNHLNSDRQGGEAIQVLDWIEQNRGRLRGEVRGPILMELSIPDDFVAAVVDKVVPKATQSAFVVNTQEDLVLLREEFRTRRRFGVNFYKINNLIPPARKVSPDVVHGGQCLDTLVGCHPIVKAQLTSFSNIHNIVLVRNMDEVVSSDKLAQLVKNTNTGILFHQCERSGHITNYSIRKSRYNPNGAPSTMKLEIPPARFKGQNSNSGPDRETLTRQLDDCRRQIAEARDQLARLTHQQEQIRNNAKTVKSEMANTQAMMQSLRKRRADVEMQNRRVTELTHELSRDFEKDAEVQKERVKKAVQQHLQALRKWKEAVEACAELAITAQSKNMEFSLVNTVFNRANGALMELEDTCTDCRRRMQAYKDEIKAIEHEMRRLTELLQGPMAPADDDEFTEIQQLEVSGDTVADQINDAKQRVENAQQQLRQTRENNEVLERYARIQASLQDAEGQLATLQARLGEARGKMEERLREFTEAVSTLADKLDREFTEYMEGMGAGGAIQLMSTDGEGEHKVKRPIKDWEMQPHVRFRKGHEMSALSGMRNSGGERAVSTIMYLMALQDLSSAPVRIVDEINQGMDERNERLVFERIVRCTKQSQYFYISPKLLQALTSMEDDDVTVLLVLNGPGLQLRNQLPYYLKLLTGDVRPSRQRDSEPSSSSKRPRLRMFDDDDEKADEEADASSQFEGIDSSRSSKRSLQQSDDSADAAPPQPQKRRV